MTNPSVGDTGDTGTGEWTIVRHRRAGRSKPSVLPSTLQFPPSTPKLPSPWTPSDPIADPELQSKLLQKIQSTIDRLERSRFYQRFLLRFHDPRVQKGLALASPIQMVVYGVGSVADYDPPRLQLALAVLIRRVLGAAVASLEVFDPVLSTTECAVVAALGCKVLPFNELGRRIVETPSLFYMPHCEAGLCDGLLEVNWAPSRLNRMVILGNSFSAYQGYVEASRGCGGSVEVTAQHVLSVRKYVKEMEIEENLVVESFSEGKHEEEVGIYNAFHNTSWHFFEVENDAELNVLEPLHLSNNIESATCEDFEKSRKKKWREDKRA